MSTPQPPAYQAPQPTAAAEPPLWAPYYGITFPNAIRRFFKKYADFTGRASRSEYWWVMLAYAIVAIILNIVSSLAGGVGGVNADGTMSDPSAGGVVVSIISLLLGLAVIVPLLALNWRRLHDANFAGPFYLLVLTFIGSIVVLVMVILPSNPNGQRFDRPRA